MTKLSWSSIRCKAYDAPPRQRGNFITTIDPNTMLGPVEGVENFHGFVTILVGEFWINVWNSGISFALEVDDAIVSAWRDTIPCHWDGDPAAGASASYSHGDPAVGGSGSSKNDAKTTKRKNAQRPSPERSISHCRCFAPLSLSGSPTWSQPLASRTVTIESRPARSQPLVATTFTTVTNRTVITTVITQTDGDSRKWKA